MVFEREKAREIHFARMQKVLEEGLTNINLAKTPAEAEEARQRAQMRLERLNEEFKKAFPEEEADLVPEAQPV